MYDEIEKLVCAIDGKPKCSDFNKLRYDMFLVKKYQCQGEVLDIYNGMDMSFLPPCRSSLEMYIRRGNYHVHVRIGFVHMKIASYFQVLTREAGRLVTDFSGARSTLLCSGTDRNSEQYSY